MDALKKIVDIIQAISGFTAIKPETKIFADGILDSLSVFNLIIELEKQFSVKIGVTDATLEDFSTPHSIVALLTRIKGH